MLSTKFFLAKGETTRKGNRGPYPQRDWRPARESVPVPHVPGPVARPPWRLGLIHDRPDHVIVPTVGIVPRDDDRGFIPFRQRLQKIHRVDDERLLIQGRRIARVTVLRAVGLQVAYRRQISRQGRLLEIDLGRTGDWPDRCGRFRKTGWRGVMNVGGAGVIFERIVVRAVGCLGRAVEAIRRGGANAAFPFT